MRMQKVQFRIGELAKQLNVEKFVIRFWEKEFSLSSTRSLGGQRFYSTQDLEQFKMIKTLLYDQGFTIAGAKKQLEETNKNNEIVGSCKTTLHKEDQVITMPRNELIALRAQLMQLRSLLDCQNNNL